MKKIFWLARDLWKKKYFAEKKKTPPLEEKVQNQLTEIESLQKKLYLNIESDVKTAAQTGFIHETEIGVCYKKNFFSLNFFKAK